jgi:SAM-dependent methyltransferase
VDSTDKTKAEQAALWNGVAGRAWVDAQQTLDGMFAPLEALLVDAVTAASGRLVLDVGCGTGSTTLAIARTIGATGRCVGIDISEPMLALARARAERERLPAEFIAADAEVYPFEPLMFDTFISRFGVMFFARPLTAFANLHRAAQPNAAMQFIAWRSAAENPFMTTAERAAAPFLPNLPPRQPDAPGQFALADRDRVHTLLQDSGWRDIDLQPLDVTCTMPESALTQYLTRLGPVGLALQDATADTRARLIELVRGAFDPYVQGEQVRFTAACWRIGARA